MKIGDIVWMICNPGIAGEVVGIVSKHVVTIALTDGGFVNVNDSDLKIRENASNPHFTNRTVNILGTEYTILFKELANEPKLAIGDGFVDQSTNEIIVGIYSWDENSISDLTNYTKKTMRHEIIHAFLYESGLWNNSNDCKAWAVNEEMVDWIAIQFPKIQIAFIEAGAL